MKDAHAAEIGIVMRDEEGRAVCGSSEATATVAL